MYVSELESGMLIQPIEGFVYYLQESRKSNLPRLRLAPEVIAIIVNNSEVDKPQCPVMYLGETKNHVKDRSFKSTKLRTVMVKGRVAFVEGREFRNFNPVC